MHSDLFEFVVQPASGVPIYRQLIDQIRALISSGRVKAGDRLPSVRQMAANLEVNMMTVSKAYARLEAEGVLQRERGLGMSVAVSQELNDREKSKTSLAERQAQLKSLAEEVATRAWQLGLTDEQTLAVIKAVLKERKS